ncbi:hypothetical protein Tco_0047887 [Tanacetum coccineum]
MGENVYIRDLVDFDVTMSTSRGKRPHSSNEILRLPTTILKKSFKARESKAYLTLPKEDEAEEEGSVEPSKTEYTNRENKNETDEEVEREMEVEEETEGGTEEEEDDDPKHFDTFPTMKELRLEPRRKPSNPKKNCNFVGRVKGLRVFVGNFTYECDIMVLADTTSVIDHYLGSVVFGKPFMEATELVYNKEEGTVDDPYKALKTKELLIVDVQHHTGNKPTLLNIKTIMVVLLLLEVVKVAGIHEEKMKATKKSRMQKTDSDLEEEEHLRTFLKLVPDKEGIIDYERFETITPEGVDLVLWGDLRTMFDANAEDELWQNQERWNLKSWNFYENCGVHTLTLEDGTEIHMLAERKYPLTKETLERMMSLKLIAESASDSAYDLLRFIQKQIDEAGSHDGGEKDL